jgi:putative hydrolase of the HAD superfamily
LFQYTIHENLWLQYREGKLNKEKLRDRRFYLTLKQLGLKNKNLAFKLNEKYLAICPLKTNLFPGTQETLTYLKQKYELFILTNGFLETQKTKLTNCGLDKYFSKIYSSEQIGYSKPHKKIFTYAVNSLNAKKEECLMIGDDPIVDVEGARKYGLQQVYFNPKKTTVNVRPTFEIDSLYQLTEIL